MRTRLGLLLFVLTVAAAAYADDWNKSYQVQGRPTIVVEADDGNVRVNGGGSSGVQVNVHTEGWRIAPDDIEVDGRQDGNRITITVRKHHTGIGFHLHTALDIRVSLPVDSDLDIHTRDGNLEAMRVKGTQKLRTGDGNAYVRDSDGSLDVDTGDGNLDVEGRFDMLSLRTGDGNIEATARGGSAMKSGWTIRTGDGNVHLRLPDNFAADIDAHTGDGHVRSDFAVTVNSTSGNGNDLRGKLNGGGMTLSIRSGDGSIEIRR